MGHHKINICIVSQEANPVAVRPHKVRGLSINFEEETIGLCIAADS
jgi:hypothetical protein